jgi:HlyD family secretion protein
MVALVVLVGLLVAAVYGSTRIFSQIGEPKSSSALVHKVAKGDLIVSVTEDGNLESASNIEIKCQVAGGSSILWIVGDGQEVKKGDKLVDLDTAVLDEQINAQKITLEKARSTMVQAEKDYQVAEISVKEYIEGTYKQELQTKDAQITISLENLRSAQNGLEHSQRMFRKGYISSLELESQQFAVQRAQLELDSAKTAKEVLEKFTKTKMLEDLQSKVATAKARLESERASFSLEESKLKRLEAQREFCSIKAPQDGMVVYANEQGGRMGGSQQVTVEEGAAVRERQTILRLPDLSQMQVKVLVHESKVDLLGRGMRARIRIQGRDLQGTVTNIANQPEPTSFFSANVKEYATFVRIDGQPDGLKPGMTAEAEILVSHLKDVLTMPVAAVVDQRGKFYCWVRKSHGEPERRPLVLGLNSDQFVEVKDGVQVGEEVLLNPRAVVEEARQETTDDEPVDVSKKFGEAQGPVEAPEPGGRTKGPGSGPGAPDGAGSGAGSGGGRPGGGPGGGGGGRMDWMSHDKNGDGKVSKDEVPEPAQNFFDNVDANKDGFIDQSDIEAMRARRGAGGAGGGGGQRGNLMSNDKDGDGKVSRDEAPAFMQSFFDRMDANGDGFVDQEESDAARRQFEKGGGGGGPGGPPK